MKKPLAVLFITCLLFTSVAAVFKQAGAVSIAIIVPDNYPSITVAIANAADGDVIYVRSGVYNETALEINKEISIRGEDLTNTIVNLNPPLLDFLNILGQSRSVPSVGIKITANNVKISGFTIISSGGIYGDGDRTEITSNIITAGRSNFPHTSTVYVSGLLTCNITGSEVTIARNTLTGDDWRFFVSNLTLVGNTINAPNNGINSNGNYCNINGNKIIGSLSVRGSSNTIANNSYSPLSLYEGDFNIIINNTGEISLGNADYSCSNNVVSGNLMKGPSSHWGILVGMNCKNGLFYDNYIVGQGYFEFGGEFSSGVMFQHEYGNMGTNNTFYHNVFVNNSITVKFRDNVTLGGNSWDNGVQGNYWSDYTGTDANGDGVGDTAYIINSENSDNHPLTTPVNEPIINIPPAVYDLPIDIDAAISQQPTPTPTPIPPVTPAANPTHSAKTNNPSTTDNPDSLVTAPEFPTPMVLLLALILFIATVVGRKLKLSLKNGLQPKYYTCNG